MDIGNPTTEDHSTCIRCEAQTINGAEICDICKEEEEFDLS